MPLYKSVIGFLKKIGDTMTGGLKIEPDTDTLTALVVNDTDANNVLTVDTINNRVGIGITTPAGNLHTASSGVASEIIQRSTENVNAAIFEIRKSRGNIASPTSTLNNDTLFRVQAGGYLASAWGSQVNGDVITAEASENWSDSASGKQLTFWTIPNTTLAPVARMRILNNGNVGIGTTAPTAKLHPSAGTATAGTAPLKLTSGVDLTTAETGAIEYDGTNLHFTPTGTLRESIHFGSKGSSTLTAGATTTITTAGAKTTSVILIQSTSAATTLLGAYVSTKANGSFVLTHGIAAGTEAFDWVLIN